MTMFSLGTTVGGDQPFVKSITAEDNYSGPLRQDNNASSLRG